jgi:hypothetical protein
MNHCFFRTRARTGNGYQFGRSVGYLQDLRRGLVLNTAAGIDCCVMKHAVEGISRDGYATLTWYYE